LEPAAGSTRRASPPRRPPSPPTFPAAPRPPCGLLEHREFIRARREEPLEALRLKLLGDKHENINHIEDECGVQLRLRGTHAGSVSLPLLLWLAAPLQGLNARRLQGPAGTEQLHFLIRAKNEKVASSCDFRVNVAT